MEYKDLEKANSEITTTDIKGKDYAEVPERITAFRKLFPEGTILTEIVSIQGGVCIFKATAMDGDKILGTGHAYEKEGSTFINKTSYIENCETSAIGRALGTLGIIGGGSMASYEEVANAKLNQDAPQTAPPQQNATPDLGGLSDKVAKIRELAKKKGITEKNICEQGGVQAIEQLHPSQMEACLVWLGGM